MNQTLNRTFARMGDGVRDASYGCSVTRYESRKERMWRWAHKVLYVIALPAVLWAVLSGVVR